MICRLWCCCLSRSDGDDYGCNRGCCCGGGGGGDVSNDGGLVRVLT